jgi:uncharacterized protein YcbX
MSSLFIALNTAVIRAPGMDPLKMPLSTEGSTVDDISVWEWSGSAYDEGAEAAEWFSTYFGKTSRLVRFKEGLKTFETFLPYFLSFRGSTVSME